MRCINDVLQFTPLYAAFYFGVINLPIMHRIVNEIITIIDFVFAIFASARGEAPEQARSIAYIGQQVPRIVQIGTMVVPISTPAQFDSGRFFSAEFKFHDVTRLDSAFTGIRFISGAGEFDLITSSMVELVIPGIYYCVPAA